MPVNVRDRVATVAKNQLPRVNEVEMLERWQASTAMSAERRLYDLSACADDLTTLAHSREGAHIIRASAHQLKQVLIKLHDLALDCKP
jgi:hypothetical protein